MFCSNFCNPAPLFIPLRRRGLGRSAGMDQTEAHPSSPRQYTRGQDRSVPYCRAPSSPAAPRPAKGSPENGGVFASSALETSLASAPADRGIKGRSSLSAAAGVRLRIASRSALAGNHDTGRRRPSLTYWKLGDTTPTNQRKVPRWERFIVSQPASSGGAARGLEILPSACLRAALSGC